MPSRAYVQTYGGTFCPNSFNFGKSLGPQPTVGYVQVDGIVDVPLGLPVQIVAGPHNFVGVVTKVEQKQDDETLGSTAIRLVDWRDRLHDELYFGAYNMQEEDGRFWHIFDEDWEFQLRTWVAVPVLQQAFNDVQNARIGDMRNFIQTGPVSAATLLNVLADRFKFRWSAERTAMAILQGSYPTNLDWNGGVKAIEAIDQLIRKCNLQFSATEYNRIHVSIRGYTENLLGQAFARGMVDVCGTGANEGSKGSEVNENGRRAHVVGGPNKYEFTFPCVIDWNPAWTWELVYGGPGQSALLESLGLTRMDQLKDMPAAYHDERWWKEGSISNQGGIVEKRTRNEMRIGEYIDTFPWKSYRVDFTHFVPDFTENDPNNVIGTVRDLDIAQNRKPGDPPFVAGLGGKPLRGFDVIGPWDDLLISSQWPIARSLVTNSNVQHTVYATSYSMVQGQQNPFGQQSFLVPLGGRCSVDIEERIQNLNAFVGGNQNLGQQRTVYDVSLRFSEVQRWLDKAKNFKDQGFVNPDFVLIKLALECELYQRVFGDRNNGLRVRTRKIPVQNLYRGFVNLVEQKVLQLNFLADQQKQGAPPVPAQQLVGADDIAQRLAWQALFHQFVNRTGHLSFSDYTGYDVDGVVESVYVSFDGESGGPSETINFTNELLDDERQISFSTIRVSTFLKTEEEIIKDRLAAMTKLAQKGNNLVKMAMNIMQQATNIWQQMFGASNTQGTFAAKGAATVKMPRKVYGNPKAKHKAGSVLILGKKKPT